MTGALTKSREGRDWLLAAMALCIALALMSILANGYMFGVGDQTESLPQVKRILDSSYLQS